MTSTAPRVPSPYAASAPPHPADAAEAPRPHDDWPNASPRTDETPWPLALRVGFRFAAVWLLLVINVGPFTELPLLNVLGQLWTDAWAPVLRWVGDHVLHTAAPAVEHPNGAGDKTVFWVFQFCALVLATVAAVVWSVVDRRRPDYRVAHDRLRIYVRYALGLTMLGYGAFKVIKLQFPDPQLAALVQPYGDFSPMAVLWRFMGHSAGYNLFAGLAEAVPAALLFWRRTTTLGALLLVAALANVVALNLTYDVTVKGYSIQLLLTAGFLLLPDARRLWDAVVMGRATPAASVRHAFDTPWLRRLHRGVKPFVALVLIGMPFFGAWTFSRQATPGAEPPLYGIYDVEAFARGGVERPPLTTDTARWRRMIVDRRQGFTIQAMNDSLRRFRGRVDTVAHTITFFPPADSARTTVLTYAPDGPGRLRLAGAVGAESLHVWVRQVDHTRFTLLARGREFRWVQDDNFNR